MNKVILFVSLIVFITSCKKEAFTGQFPTDGTAPGPVMAPRVSNLEGRAVITYDIPSDPDLLYVKATYTRNGRPAEQRASIYSQELVVEGFGRSAEHTVELRTVDRSNNESAPVLVTVKPADAPIYSVLNTMAVQNDFGGIRLDWANQSEADLVVTVVTPTQMNGVTEMREVQSFYSKAKASGGNVRGYQDPSRTFGVTIRDRWGNKTDTLYDDYTPLYETQLDKLKFRRWNPPGIPYNAYTTSNWYIENLWNNSITSGFANYNLEFTFDMGQLAKLSRFKINQRPENNLIYNLGHPKKFQVWGSATSNVSDNFNTWTLLGEFESVKPSGLPLGGVTTEDIQYANVKGEEWNVPLTAPPVRYLRFVCLQTWANASVIQVMEMTLWGDTKINQ
ncbi:DUF5000 domain-containing lipoprotein [Niabella drilacis]|uniref:F5/8 type C domain-containing protein n=1 Tax=Niabella drilacis (strain DSM 25811 / CCM 8410 / CCUG 62505 / LMG 26954 / E90) TaxID=1285928 RepID=A0A1G6Y0S8_NIADE|nr:DUF5000 domain-containing lipoprotein [Niabella drilacis]SDD83882.1 protein of unknown function [Niabella drilacis]